MLTDPRETPICQMDDYNEFESRFSLAQHKFHTAICMKQRLPDAFLDRHQEEIENVLKTVNFKIRESVWRRRSDRLIGRPPLSLGCFEKRPSTAVSSSERRSVSFESSFRHPFFRLYYIKNTWR